MPLLQVNNLQTHFFSDETVTRAVDGHQADGSWKYVIDDPWGSER